MTTPIFGLRHPPCRNARDVAQFAKRAEEAGFDMAWFPDSQLLWRNVWATLALAAEATSHIGLGTAITNFETRHVSVTAAAACTIDELAPGRLRVGFGTGDSAVKTLGLRPTKLSRMRDQIDLFRRLTRGDSVTFGDSGDYAHREMRLSAARESKIPVFMAASGPKALTLAGEVADGVIMLSGVGERQVRQGLAHIDRGLANAGRTRDEVEVWVAAHTFVTADRATAARMVKPLCITSAQLGASDALRAAGIEIAVPKVVPGIYPDVTHAVDWEAAIRGSDAYVTAEQADIYAENFTFAGTVEDIIGRIDVIRELGISHFYIQGPLSYELPALQLEAFAKHIIPHFRR
jgi:5,10-methylenetetrahydromethanopterin reductase